MRIVAAPHLSACQHTGFRCPHVVQVFGASSGPSKTVPQRSCGRCFLTTWREDVYMECFSEAWTDTLYYRCEGVRFVRV